MTQDPSHASPAPATPAPKTYTVQAGDTLSDIAQRTYGNANEWQKIVEANKTVLTNPDVISPGTVLTLPD
jgi:nucleoid-associated protein YgaU